MAVEYVFAAVGRPVAIGGEFRDSTCSAMKASTSAQRLVDVQETLKNEFREPAWMARMTVARATTPQDIELSPDHAALIRFERQKAQ